MKTHLKVIGVVSQLVFLMVCCEPAFASVPDPSIDINHRWAEKAFAEDATSPLPFSFVYGGKPSSELVSSWQRRVVQTYLDKNRIRRTLILTDPETKLEIRDVATLYTDTAGVDWMIHITNHGKTDSPILEKFRAVDVTLAANTKDAPVLHSLYGCYPPDSGEIFRVINGWLPVDVPLPEGKRVEYKGVGGKATWAHSSIFNVESGGRGVITAVGWIGQWLGVVEHVKNKGVRIQAGMENMHLKLRPGETIRTPRIIQLYWHGKEADAYNSFRRMMFAHILPRLNGKLFHPPIAYAGTHLFSDDPNFNPHKLEHINKYTTEANAMKHLHAIADLEFEYFWMDAFFTRNGFSSGQGNYDFPVDKVTPDPVRFPNGLKPLADAVLKQDKKFIVWYEPERVAWNTVIWNKYPHFHDRLGLFNMGLPEAREFMTKYLDAVIKEYKLGCLRIDCCINPLPSWQEVDKKDPNRVGMAEIRYVEGWYRMLDDIIQKNPGTFIDNCAGGGTRLEIEMCARSIPLWRTDAVIYPINAGDLNGTAIRNQVITAGLSRYIPFTTGGSSGSSPYHFRSGISGGGITFNQDVRPEGYPREQLKQAIAELKRIRKYFLGDFYTLTKVTVDPKDWCITQYHRPVEKDGMIMAFRRHEAAESTMKCRPHGIDPKLNYEVKSYTDYKLSDSRRMSGAELQSLELKIDKMPGSVLVEYKAL
ncbi:MAG: alpha-galactosidase [Pirellulales bacterium]|nr:alpha-galactosidase [Pirellulales bacterium]